jgi:hypothetical protein
MNLSTADVNQFKKVYSVIVIVTNCEPSAAKDKTLPRNSYLIKCEKEETLWYDIVMGFQVDIFNAYYDKYGDVIKSMTWTEGSILPKLWGYQQKESSKSK